MSNVKERAGLRAMASIAVACLALLGGCVSMSSDSANAGPRTVSDETDLQKRAQIRLQLAVGYYAQGQTVTALDEVKQALLIDPDYADAHGMRALIYMNLGEAKLAEESFQRAMRLAPNNPELLNNYGWFLCQNGRPKDSIPYFESALKVRNYQKPATALNNAGACSLKQKDVAGAERYLTQAFAMDPGNVDINTNLAKLNYGMGDFSKAKFYITRATKSERLNPDMLWTAIKVERKLGDKAAETGLATQLRRRYPGSQEYAAYLRGAFDE